VLHPYEKVPAFILFEGARGKRPISQDKNSPSGSPD
jgi:hypothetical protein